MAQARDLSGLKHHVLAVIGDGSLTAGEAFEGLNLAGHMGRRLIVVLNDNEMSISPNVGALSLFLSRTLSQRWVRQTRKEVLNFLRSIPRIGQKLAVYAMQHARRRVFIGLRADGTTPKVLRNFLTRMVNGTALLARWDVACQNAV